MTPLWLERFVDLDRFAERLPRLNLSTYPQVENPLWITLGMSAPTATVDAWTTKPRSPQARPSWQRASQSAAVTNSSSDVP